MIVLMKYIGRRNNNKLGRAGTAQNSKNDAIFMQLVS